MSESRANVASDDEKSASKPGTSGSSLVKTKSSLMKHSTAGSSKEKKGTKHPTFNLTDVNKNIVRSDIQSKVNSFANLSHSPGGGNFKLFTEVLNFKQNARSRCGSLDNLHFHKPHPSEIKNEVFSQKLDFKENAKSKCGSLENIKYTNASANFTPYSPKPVTPKTPVQEKQTSVSKKSSSSKAKVTQGSSGSINKTKHSQLGSSKSHQKSTEKRNSSRAGQIGGTKARTPDKSSTLNEIKKAINKS